MWLIAGLSCGAAARSADLFEMSLEQLLEVEVVTASGYLQSSEEAASVMTVLTANEIAYTGATNLHQLLTRVPGVYPFGETSFRDNLVSIRGQHSNIVDRRTLLMINGRPVRDAHVGGLNNAIYRTFPLSQIEKVEVVRGPGSVLYGSNAISGVINIITKKSAVNRLDLEADGLGTHSGQLSLGGDFSQREGRWQLTMLAAESDGFDFDFTQADGTREQVPYGYRQHSLTAEIDYGSLHGSLFHSNIEDTVVGSFVPAWPATQYQFERTILNLGNQFQLDDKTQLNLDWTLNKGARETVGVDVEDEYHLVDFKMIHDWSDTIKINAGISIQNWDIEDRSQPQQVVRKEVNWHSLFAQGEYLYSDQTNVTLGAQYYDIGSETNVSWRAAWIHKLNANWTTKLLWAEAFRAPFGAEQSFNTATLKGNPDLTAEQMTNLDWQLLYKSERYTVDLSLYRGKLRDAIQIAFVPELGYAKFLNLGELEFEGGELVARYRPKEKLELSASYSYQNNTNGAGQNNTQVIPNEMLKLGLQWQPKEHLHVSVFNTFYGAPRQVAEINPQVAVVNPKAKSYHHLDLTISIDGQYIHSDWHNWRLKIGGRNLLQSEEVYLPTLSQTRENSAPARAGRHFFVSSELRF